MRLASPDKNKNMFVARSGAVCTHFVPTTTTYADHLGPSIDITGLSCTMQLVKKNHLASYRKTLVATCKQALGL